MEEEEDVFEFPEKFNKRLSVCMDDNLCRVGITMFHSPSRLELRQFPEFFSITAMQMENLVQRFPELQT